MADHPVASVKGVAALMGGRRVLGKVSEPADMVSAVRKGLPFAALTALSAELDLPHHEITSILGVAPRTLARRKQSRHLSAVESDRLYRIAHIAQLAVEVLGDVTRARLWLHRPNRALRGESPLKLLDTEVGGREVQDCLLRLSYGVYA